MLRLRLILLPLTLFPGSSAGISFYTSIWILYWTEYLFARWSRFTVCLDVWLHISIRTKYKVLKIKILHINNIGFKTFGKHLFIWKFSAKCEEATAFYLQQIDAINMQAIERKALFFRNFITYKSLLKTFLDKWPRLKVILQALKMYDASAKVLVDKDDQCIILRYWLLMWLMTWWQFYWS